VKAEISKVKEAGSNIWAPVPSFKQESSTKRVPKTNEDLDQEEF